MKTGQGQANMTVSVSCSLQCFDTDDGLAVRTSSHEKNLVRLTSRDSLLEQLEENLTYLRGTRLPLNIHTHNHFTALFPGLPVWDGARRNLLLDFMVQGKIIWGRHTDNPAGCHSIRTNQRPPPSSSPFLCRMSFLTKPSQFIVAWDRHQIRWLA